MLSKLKALHEAATPGPWFRDGSTFHEGDCQSQHRPEYSYPGAYCNCDTANTESAALIVAMRNCLPELLAVVSAAEAVYNNAHLKTYTEFTTSEAALGKMDSALAALEERLGDV